ncbi:MAG: hypothetical protein WCT02_01255 [Candidatus Paceibacterota bacterium]
MAYEDTVAVSAMARELACNSFEEVSIELFTNTDIRQKNPALARYAAVRALAMVYKKDISEAEIAAGLGLKESRIAYFRSKGLEMSADSEFEQIVGRIVEQIKSEFGEGQPAVSSPNKKARTGAGAVKGYEQTESITINEPDLAAYRLLKGAGLAVEKIAFILGIGTVEVIRLLGLATIRATNDISIDEEIERVMMP